MEGLKMGNGGIRMISGGRGMEKSIGRLKGPAVCKRCWSVHLSDCALQWTTRLSYENPFLIVFWRKSFSLCAHGGLSARPGVTPQGPCVEGNSNWSKQECIHPCVITTKYQDQPLNSARGLGARSKSSSGCTVEGQLSLRNGCWRHQKSQGN